MKRALCLIGLICMALPVACSPREPLVTKAAKDMNLTPGDFDQPFVLNQESELQGLLELVNLNKADSVGDANLRVFSSEAQGAAETQVIAAVLVFGSAGTADTGLQDARKGFQEALGRRAPGMTMNDLSVQLGDQRYFGQSKTADQEGQVYLLLFREANVVGLVSATGMGDRLDQDAVLALGQKLADRIPPPTSSN